MDAPVSTPACPDCGCHKVAAIHYGLPALDEDLESDLCDQQLTVTGCHSHNDTPQWYCTACHQQFGCIHADVQEI